ncbi:outer membrane transport energization protein TonB [Algoriphagus faecimaris]|uniref:Outer membrane transport energization protein TonB n=1 Tax=Algoriphagus faecimaris TaxID=686796 RepID=A0A1G6S383_9BACT|nr:M56 family metallopeptidase [Algoriphagus faecimaris]SDD11318.1 outer membrane transport energization protein TonB [Algoriphagus faecimaris]
MSGFLNYLIEGSLCLLLGWGFYRVFLEKLTFFDWNRSILLLLMGVGLIVPLLSFEAVVSTVSLTEYTLPLVEVGNGSFESGFSLSWQEALVWIYGIGFLVFLGRILLGIAKPIFQLQMVEKLEYQGMKLAIHPSFEPASFFNYILLPYFDPQDEDLQKILLHESVHVSKRHTFDLILLQLVKAIFWFNPAVYLFERSLREVHEYQADQGVTRNYSQIDYSRLLLRLITQDQGWQFTNSFNQFQTKKRIVMMNKEESKNLQKGRFLMILPILGLMVFAFSCDQNIGEEPIKPENIVEIIDEDGNAELKAIENGRVIEMSADEIFDVVEDQPNPAGGMQGWNQYLSSNLVYPEQAKKEGVEGTVIVVFVINTDGSIQDVDILRGIGAGCDEAAIRVVQNAPNWEPGKQRGREVRTRMRLPIRFKLS